MNNPLTIVLLGKTPPPIGGVTIHVSRLLALLKTTHHVEFVNLIPTNAWLILLTMLRCRNAPIHLHTSSPLVRICFALLARLIRCRSIITYHGNLGRFGILKNTFDYASIAICTTPVVLNEGSFQKARRLNKKTKLASAFVPPQNDEPLSEQTIIRIKNLKKSVNQVYCTCAFALTRDKYGKEIYGINELVSLFRLRQECGLIISDPSGDYTEHFKQSDALHLSNIIIIRGLHSFYEVLKLSDAYIRHTTTDGDSLSVRESISLGKITYATSKVSRPDGVITYATTSELAELIEHPPSIPPLKTTATLDSITILHEYSKIYENHV